MEYVGFALLSAGIFRGALLPDLFEQRTDP